MSKDEYLITDAPLKALTFFCNANDSGQFFFSKYIIWLTPSSLVSLLAPPHLRLSVPVQH